MRSRFAKLLRWWPIGILLFLEAILFSANYKHGTFLMGWDNVMPEFNFRQALVTNIFGVWQEHRGLGLYDGMGHAANLIHTIFLWLLSLALPTNLLRYIFHFLMHVLGGIGAYVLLKKAIDKHNATTLKLSINQWIGLTGALFYQYNLATIQMFYTPLEAFSVHFTALPWLAWSLMTYLQEGSPKKFLIFLLVSFLSIPQFFIPTLLLPVGILLGSIMVFTQESIFRTQDALLKKPITAFVGFLLINAFWLLPYIYGLPHNAPVIRAAKINQMSTDEVFARNQAFGGLGDILRLRGFPLDFEDMGADGTTTFLMASWREFLQLPFVTLGSWFLVTLTVFGIGMNGFLAPFIASLLFLANDTPLIKEATAVIRDSMPLLGEAYRFPFTKFSLLFAFSSSVFFTIGLARIAKIRIVTIIVIGFIVILSLPAFRGNFISDGLRVELPDDYLRVFAFMKDKPPSRVAYLPQQQYWSWKYYRWGYRGSGFAWYGLSQLIMDRAFDPWSGYNENYYWELSRSIYSKDVGAFDAVLTKYDVRYVLLDEHIISPSHNRALFMEEIKTMLAILPEIREAATFGKLTVYERWIPDQVGDDITVKTDLPLVSPAYRWTDNDMAFGELGDYVTNEIASPRQLAGTRNDIWTYPFRSLFTKRNVSEREFTITETSDATTIRSIVEATGASILKTDALVYDSTRSTDLVADNVKPCGVLREGTAMAENLDQFLRFTSRNQRGCLSFGIGNLSHREGYLITVESRHVSGRPLLFSLINDTARHVELETYLRGPTDYFILPPLAPDGLDYSVYLSNDAIGRQETVNDIKSIRFYRIPYQQMVTMRSITENGLDSRLRGNDANDSGNDMVKIDHPNPAFYKISFQPSAISDQPENTTLILSQSFDNGWVALQKTNRFPFFTPIGEHVLVNNWANGWRLQSDQFTNPTKQIVIFFWPQLLQWIGFLMLPIPFLYAFRLKN